MGQHYKDLRKPDPRIAAKIYSELTGSESVINVGAGTGSYEPVGVHVTAVEPSEIMIAQRKECENTVVCRACVEDLPFVSGAFDYALSVLSIHHWSNWQRGLEQVLRVTREKVVLLTWINTAVDFWLYDYLPEIKEIDKDLFPSLEQLSSVLGEINVIPIPVPSDCTDGFMCAYWARPERYLDERTRSAISSFSRIQNAKMGLDKLNRDLATGLWQEKYGLLLDLSEFDFGYRLVIAKK